MKPIVLDASVIAKLFVNEQDSEQAIGLFDYLIHNKIPILAPELAKYEVANLIVRLGLDLQPVLDFYEGHMDNLIDYVQPQTSTWLLAEEIVRSINKRQHAPYMYGCIYHALAMEIEGTLITADKKHRDETIKYKHILMLEDWQLLKA